MLRYGDVIWLLLIVIEHWSTFDWCVEIRWGSKNKHQKETRLKEIEFSLSIFFQNYDTLGRTYVICGRVKKHALLITK